MIPDCLFGARGLLPCSGCQEGCAHLELATQPVCLDAYDGYMPCGACRPGCPWYERSLVIGLARATGCWSDGTSLENNPEGMERAGQAEWVEIAEATAQVCSTCDGAGVLGVDAEDDVEGAAEGLLEPCPDCLGATAEDAATVAGTGNVVAVVATVASVPLSEVQEAAVAHRDGPALVVSGAGSGKTRVLTERIVRLAQGGVDPSQILALTFTRKAALQMKERIAKRAPWIAEKTTLTTFHSLALSLCREWARLVGRRPRFSVWDDRASLSEVRRLLRELWAERVFEGKIREDVAMLRAGELARFVDKHRDRGRPLDAAFFGRLEGKYGEVAVATVVAYEDLKRAANALDFADLVRCAVQLLEDRKEVRDEVQKRWTHLLVDEYQDTNDLQERLLVLLIGSTQNLFCVGDEDQAIFAFRGSNAEYILTFSDRYQGAETFWLGENYRSQAHVVEAAATVIRHNVKRRDKRIWTENPPQGPVVVHEFIDELGEASAVVHGVATSIRSGCRPAEHAVLVRLRRQFIPLQGMFARRGINVVTVGERELHQRADIKLVLSWWRAVYNPRDVSAGSLMLSEWPKLGAGLVDAWSEWIENTDGGMFDHLEGLHSKPRCGLNTVRGQSLVKFLGVWRKLVAHVHNGSSIRDLATWLFSETGLDEEIEELSRSGDSREAREGERRSSTRVMFLSLCPAVATPGWTQVQKIGEFVDNLLMRGRETEKGGLESVVLTTIHSAKGLEWDKVWVVGLCEKILPHSRKQTEEVEEEDEGDGVEEERRLAYVAFTRARMHLTLSWPRVTMQDGSKDQAMERSRFLDEMQVADEDEIVIGEEAKDEDSFTIGVGDAGAAAGGDDSDDIISL
jgi:DNA helicase II / ATP-dependent DNA helicase PcrA